MKQITYFFEPFLTLFTLMMSKFFIEQKKNKNCQTPVALQYNKEWLHKGELSSGK